MNHSMFNSSVFNGAGIAVGVIAASAAIVCSAGIEVHSTRVVRPAINFQGAASTAVQATRVPQGQAEFNGAGQMHLAASHIKPSFASFTGSAEFQGFVLREVFGQAGLLGGAELLAIPAGIIAYSDVFTGAELVADATKIQPGYSHISANAEFVNTPALVTRYVVAQPIEGQGSFYAEVTINDETEAYSVFDVTGRLLIEEVSLVKRLAEASIEVSGDTSARATYIQPGAADSIGIAITFAGEPHSRQSPMAFMDAGASLLASGIRCISSASCVMDAQARVRAAPNQRFSSARARFEGTSQIDADTRLRRFVRAEVIGTASIKGAALRSVKPSVNVLGHAQISSQAVRTAFGATVGLKGSSEFKATPDITIRKAYAQFQALAQMTGEAAHTWRFGEAKINVAAALESIPDITIREGVAFIKTAASLSGKAAQTWRYGEMNGVYSAELTASGLRIVLPLGAPHTNGAQVKVEATRFTYAQSQISLASEFYADTVMNPESHDPSDRIFIRTDQPTTFYRPSAEIVFRRAA